MVNNTNKNNAIPHNRPTLSREEEKMAVNVIRSGWISQGNAVENFENEVCSYLGLPLGSAVAVSSGTAAIYLALIAMNAKGKTITYPTYCCSSLRHATTLVGGKSILLDSSIDSPNMNLEALNQTNDIVIIPHMFGIPQDLSKYSPKITIIEDCAQALGARVGQNLVGLQGNVGIFSFYATKLITSGGQGGMVVSRDTAIINELKDYRAFDQKADKKNRFNFQMTDLQAAIGRKQLQRFPEFIKVREEIYQQYQEANFPLLHVNANIQPVRFRAILKTPKQIEIISALAKENISAVIPLQESELFGLNECFPNALYWTHNTVSLPIYPSLSNKDVKRIIKIVKEVL